MTENKKIFLRWWLVAALIYLAFSGAAVWFYGADFLMPANDDSAHHIKLAENLVKYKTFSLDGLYSAEEPRPPLKPTNFLAPGYAFWLVLIYIFFKSFIPAIFIGAAIFAISIPLTYFLAKEITAGEKIAFWSALVFMVEPLSIYHSGFLLTEQIFVPLFLAGAYWFIKYFKNNDLKILAVSLVVFSFATLVRPIIFYFLPMLILAVILKELKISFKRALKFGLISLVLAYSITGLWLIRNKIVLNTWQISGNQGAILAAHYDVLSRDLKKQANYIEPAFPNVGGLDTFSVEYNKIVGEFALKQILNNKLDYLKIYSGYTLFFFIRSGYDNIVSQLTGLPALNGNLRTALTLKLLNGDIFGAVLLFFQAPATIWITFVGAFFWLAASISAAIGFFDLARKKFGINNFLIFYCGFLIIYFALVSSIFSVARYRLPVNPFIFIFAVSGVYFLKNKLRQWI
ncbi:MAG: glycosyltransferase family 39 protein [Candidatus Azambacteria bacterium]|nr:glycosyltransferase family 39 protein [Candidatus Azambacteria bacterium]